MYSIIYLFTYLVIIIYLLSITYYSFIYLLFTIIYYLFINDLFIHSFIQLIFIPNGRAPRAVVSNMKLNTL